MNIIRKTGKNSGGVCTLLLAPISWLQNKIKSDFGTDKVTAPILLLPGKDFIKVMLLERTYQYTEDPKESKAGSYFEIGLAGILDYMDPLLQTSLEALRYQQIIAIIQFKNGSKKILGNQDFGMTFRYSQKNITDNSGGLISVSIEITGNQTISPPFYML